MTTGHYGKTKYQSLSFLQDAILFFVNYLSFMEHNKKVFHFFLHLYNDHRFALVYPYLKVVDIPSSCIFFYLDQDLSFEPYDVHDQFCEPHVIKVDITPLEHNIMPSKIQERYKPLRLPNTFHGLPPKNYKYLPKFDGKLDNLTTEKHIEEMKGSILKSSCL